jgi:hypothetical protein
MKLASTRLKAADLLALVGFYGKVTGQTAVWLTPIFAEIVTSAAVLAIGSVDTNRPIYGKKRNTSCQSFCDYRVSRRRCRCRACTAKGHGGGRAGEKNYALGIKAAQFRDLEGTLLGLFALVTVEAKRRVASR